MSGRRVQLTDTSLLALSEVERLTLQKIALSRLHEIDLGVPVTVPKGKLILQTLLLHDTCFDVSKL